ncbi:MAG: phosphotransferase [Candidatus Dormibacteraeota bacterium]|uniref:Phosphotransferase n=1 Tax=Candidatus Aeolococcus gillhamiae TaxID=3127015 RepID=A0A2W6A4A1_9BACT|nr:phosphotransferase [Candidatus Dormibacteraeota bacterium]PZR78424.1 MAG: hypothetical protein DLM65_12995 [Candidatus Dormibacter sp. RRmetagenome_bin12]
MSDAPPDGLAWKPRHSGNSLSWDGEAIVKDFGAAIDRREREQACLAVLGGVLPVPALLAGSSGGRLRMAYVDGAEPDAAIEGGRAAALLEQLGRFLRALHEFDCSQLAPMLPGEGDVLVHGDFGHHNALINPSTGELAAVVDWEEARWGDRVTDLAWCEWQFRTRFERQGWGPPSVRGIWRHARAGGSRSRGARASPRAWNRAPLGTQPSRPRRVSSTDRLSPAAAKNSSSAASTAAMARRASRAPGRVTPSWRARESPGLAARTTRPFCSRVRRTCEVIIGSVPA